MNLHSSTWRSVAYWAGTRQSLIHQFDGYQQSTMNIYGNITLRESEKERGKKKMKKDKRRKEGDKKKNLPDVLYLILRPIRIEDGVPGCAAFARRLSVMVRL